MTDLLRGLLRHPVTLAPIVRGRIRLGAHPHPELEDEDEAVQDAANRTWVDDVSRAAEAIARLAERKR